MDETDTQMHYEGFTRVELLEFMLAIVNPKAALPKKIGPKTLVLADGGKPHMGRGNYVRKPKVLNETLPKLKKAKRAYTFKSPPGPKSSEKGVFVQRAPFSRNIKNNLKKMHVTFMHELANYTETDLLTTPLLYKKYGTTKAVVIKEIQDVLRDYGMELKGTARSIV